MTHVFADNSLSIGRPPILAKLPELRGKTIVVVLPDAGERYLSSVLFDGMFDPSTGL